MNHSDLPEKCILSLSRNFFFWERNLFCNCEFWKNLLLLRKVFQAASFLCSQQRQTWATRTSKQSTCEWTFKPVINQQRTTVVIDKLTTWLKVEKSKPGTEALHSVSRNVLQLQFLSRHSWLIVKRRLSVCSQES